MKAVVSLTCLNCSYNAGKDDSNNINRENMLLLSRQQPLLYLLSRLWFASTVCPPSTPWKRKKQQIQRGFSPGWAVRFK